jgi:hypothetical protein
MMTEAPTAPEVGERLFIFGPTVNVTPLLANPPTDTTTDPVTAPAGTGTVMLLALQLLGLALVPLKVIVLVPWVEPKVVPLIVIESPTAPDVGERLFILGPTVKVTPLLADPAAVTTTGPVVPPEGTGATMLVLLQLVGVATVPLKVTVLVP